MFGQPMNQCLQMNVGRLVLQETGTYNPLFRRPYELHANGENINNIINRVVEHGTGQITGQLLAGAAGSILAPSSVAEKEIYIPNGWNEKRVRFFLEVHCQFSFGLVIYYIQGYTNYNGITQTAIAPDMRFVINSILCVTRTQMMTPGGITTVDIPKESFQVMGDGDNNGAMQEKKFLMRPHDVFTGMHNEYLRNAIPSGYGEQIIDNRSELRNSNPMRSSRSYGVPTNYIAKVIDNYTQATLMMDYGGGTQDALSRARESSLDSPLMENPFIRFISDTRGMGTVNYFTFGDLVRLDPNTDNVTNLIVTPAIHQMTVHQTGQTAFWHGSDRITQVANILSQAVPALMMETMLQKIHFRSTNYDSLGNVRTDFAYCNGLTNMDLTPNMERFKMRLANEVLFDMSFGNQDSYMIDMSVDMFGDTTMEISMYGETVKFVTPSFCDNLLAPVLAGNENQFFGLVQGFDSLVNEVTGSLAENTQHKTKPVFL